MLHLFINLVHFGTKVGDFSLLQPHKVHHIFFKVFNDLIRAFFLSLHLGKEFLISIDAGLVGACNECLQGWVCICPIF